MAEQRLSIFHGENPQGRRPEWIGKISGKCAARRTGGRQGTPKLGKVFFKLPGDRQLFHTYEEVVSS